MTTATTTSRPTALANLRYRDRYSPDRPFWVYQADLPSRTVVLRRYETEAEQMVAYSTLKLLNSDACRVGVLVVRTNLWNACRTVGNQGPGWVVIDVVEG